MNTYTTIAFIFMFIFDIIVGPLLLRLKALLAQLIPKTLNIF